MKDQYRGNLDLKCYFTHLEYIVIFWDDLVINHLCQKIKDDMIFE